jgi:hypothetical protein
VSTNFVDIRVTKTGPNGTPLAEVLVSKSVTAAQLAGIVRRVTTDKELLRKVGLKACPNCKSGLDIFIRDRFEHVLEVDIREFGG